MEKVDDALTLYNLKLSDQFLFEWYFQHLPLKFRRLPISQAETLLPKKPHITKRFAKRLKRSLDGDIWWIAKDLDLLHKKIDQLPALVPKSPPAKRVFRTWQRAIRDRGPLSLEKNEVYYRKVLSALFEDPGITAEEKNTIGFALTLVTKGIRKIVRELSKIYKVEDVQVSWQDQNGKIRYDGLLAIWRLPNGSPMLFGSDFDVGPDDSDEDKNFKTPWEDRIADTRPQCKEDIAALVAYNRFDLSHEVEKHAPLTRLERQILLLKCRSDISVKEIARELRKPIKSVSNTYYNARQKMDKWLEAIGMKEILKSNDGRTDSLARWLFEPPFKSPRLPQLWDDYWGKNPGPIKEWFGDQHDQDFLKSLIPPDEEKPFLWSSFSLKSEDEFKEDELENEQIDE